MSRIRKIQKVATLYGVSNLSFRSFPALSAVPAVRQAVYSYLRGDGRADHIALTFDDGPDPVSTPLILDELDRLQTTATFFMLGTMAEAYPYLAKEVKNRGHEVALHGHWHRNHLFRSTRSINYDMERSLASVSEASETTITHFRPPYGVFARPTLQSAKRLSLKPVLWGTWGRDWRKNATVTSVMNDIKKDLVPGVTVLLHDSDCTSYPGSFHSTLGSLEKLIEVTSENGWGVGPLRDHGF